MAFDYETALEFLKQMARALGNLLGEKCEVVLHDMRAPESSIVEIIHGDITGRKVGDPSTDLGLPVYNDRSGTYDRYNYRSRTKTGKILKSSSIYFKDSAGCAFAALCLNYDISELIVAANTLRDLTTTDEQVDEQFATDINEVITRILDETLQTASNGWLLGDKEERLKLIRTLDAKGVFTVKGTVDRVAKMLGVSRVTVYGYLSEVQTMKRDNVIP